MRPTGSTTAGMSGGSRVQWLGAGLLGWMAAVHGAEERPASAPPVRLGQPPRLVRVRPEALAVDFHRLLAALVRDEMGEAVGQAEIGRDLRAVIGAAEHPDFRDCHVLGEAFDLRERMAFGQRRSGEPALEIADVGDELIGPLVRQGMERISCTSVGAGCAAKAQIDAAGRDGIEHAELLGYVER